MVLAVIALAAISCGSNGEIPELGGSTKAPITITTNNISGVGIPALGRSPCTNITGTQWTGIVVWYEIEESELAEAKSASETGAVYPLYANEGGTLFSGTDFEVGAIYKAVIKLTAKPGYKLSGIRKNFFSVNGAAAVFNPVNSGIIHVYYDVTENDKYTVTFDSNLSEDEIASGAAYPSEDERLINRNAKLTLPQPPVRKGYVFGGWFKDGSEYTSANTVSADLELTANWLSYTIDISFNKNSTADEITPTPSVLTLTSPETTIQSLPELNWTGRTMSYWNTNAAATGAFVESTTDISILADVSRSNLTANITLYAQWTQEGRYTVFFNPMGGTATGYGRIDVDHDTAIGTLPGNPVRDNWNFSEWKSNRDGGGSTLNAATIITGNITYYAQYTFAGYQISFDERGGSAVPDITAAALGLPIGTLPVTALQSYRFDAWYTGIDGNGAKVTASTVPTSNMTLYANWVFDKYTITFNGNGAAAEATPLCNYIFEEAGGQAALPLTEPQKTNYIFAGWTKTQNGSDFFTELDLVTSDIEVFAKWTFDKYTITFNGNNAEAEAYPASSDVVVESGGTATLPTTKPKKTNYLFDCWTTTQNGTTEFTASDTITSDITVYAKWLEVPSGWTYDAITCGMYKNYAYTGSAEEWVVVKAGNYKFELWGAEGGGHNSVNAGKGGYIYGTLFANKNIIFYIYVGGKGTNSAYNAPAVAGGWNGGGASGGTNSGWGTGSGGGGASDVRTSGTDGSTVWNSNLATRIIVAGGGGGSTWYGNSVNITPAGGKGGIGNANGTNGGNGYGTGGSGGNLTGGSGFSLGAGGIGTLAAEGGAGGGGGYYGGKGGGPSSGGGGGSSWASVTTFTSIGGSGTGNTGNGKIVITYIP